MAESSRFKRDGDDPSEHMLISSGNAENDLSSALQPSTPPAGLTLLHTLEGHTNGVVSVAWSPDGKWLASGAYDQTVRVWDPSSGRLLHTFEGHTGSVYSLAWSPDGKWLASGSMTKGVRDTTVRVWDPGTGRLLHTLKGHTDGIWSLAWSPDGKWLASSSGSRDGTVRVWDPGTGRVLHTLKGHSSHVGLVVWSPDGKWLVSSSSDGTVRVWDPGTGRLLHTLEGNMRGSEALAWSPDGKWLASGAYDGTVWVWDSDTGRLLHTLEGHTGSVYSLAWSPNGKWLASAASVHWSSEQVDVRIWQSETWEALVMLTNIEGRLPAIWHPHLSLLVTAGQRKGDLFIWHLDWALLLQAAPALETVHYTNAKVVLVGDSGVGKSGLALALTQQPFVATESTHGRHVWLLDQQEVKQASGPRETREVLLWDLAGQRDYRLIHQLHLHEATVALIVFDAARDTDPFAGIRHWHRALQQAQQASGLVFFPLVIFLVAARIDRGGGSVSRVRIEALCKELDCAGYIETSAKDGRGIVELGQTIRAAIDWSRLPKITSTALLQSIKTFILHEQQAGRLLHTVDDLYEAFLRFNSVSPQQDKFRQQLGVALGRLEAQGTIRQLGFGQLILLQPELLDAYASALLIAAKDEPDGLGSIPEVRVQQGDFPVPSEDRLPNSTQERLLLIAMIDELVRHQLVLRESGLLLFPSQSTREHPEQNTLEGKCVVAFPFAGPVLSIYTTLVVRLAQSGIFQKLDFWQYVITYTTRLGGTYGLLLSPQGEERAEVGLFFDEAAREEMRFHFEDFIFRHLEHHASGEVQRKRRFVCPGCGEAFTETQVSNRRTRGFTSMRCSICETEVSLLDGEERFTARPTSLVESMEQTADGTCARESTTTIRQGKVLVQETNKLQLQVVKNTAQPLHIYISSASTPEDEALLDELEKQLSMVKRQPNVRLWEKRLIAPGANWEQDIATYLHQAHLILFLVSPDFLASDYCYEEMKEAIRQREARDAWVLPVLIRHTASWQETPVGKLEPLPVDRKPVRDRIDREKAMRTIAERIQDITQTIRQSLTESSS